jgi:pSer/pThr/pTyr-binding forkhead associated (FHA) protein
MPKMTLSIDGVVIKEIQLTKERTTLGRRPYNDIVIDNLAVSGEHAAITVQGNEVFIEDLGSTNGTYIDGKTIKKHQLKNQEIVEIGKYRIQFFADRADQSHEKTMLARPDMNALGANAKSTPNTASGKALLKVLTGAAAGREVPLVKVVTTVGKPGTAVAAITKRPQSYVIALIEGSQTPTLNGSPISSEPVALRNNDMLDLAGTRMQFTEE